MEYYASVTAFDYGSPTRGLQPLESSKSFNMTDFHTKNVYSEQQTDNIIVYPNPYRINANYRDAGLEGRNEEDRPDYRVRAINFLNIPNRCTISIYSLDGDLVRRLEHEAEPSDPNGHFASWDLITRNTEMVVSGLYYWVVESENGKTEIGKLVIIM
ncbi:MAG: hypothetical protein DWP97_08810 [Calditrichaeota bacterium]|nr:MAG: hypothetical protein DWP97_08810 [Calditrichota bacterium]